MKETETNQREEENETKTIKKTQLGGGGKEKMSVGQKLVNVNDGIFSQGGYAFRKTRNFLSFS